MAERALGEAHRRDPAGVLDYVVVFGECHLRHVLASYAAINNQARMHLSLNKDAPLSRPIQTIGCIPFHDQSWADCIIIMSGFSFRQGQHPTSARAPCSRLLKPVGSRCSTWDHG